MLSAETDQCCFHVVMGTDCPGYTVTIRYDCNTVQGIIGPNGSTVMDPDSYDTGIPTPLILCMPHGTEFSVEHWWCLGGLQCHKHHLWVGVLLLEHLVIKLQIVNRDKAKAGNHWLPALASNFDN